MQKVLVYVLFIVVGLVFTNTNFAQDADRDLKPRDSKDNLTSENVKSAKTDTKPAKQTVAVLSFEDASLGNKELSLGKHLIDSLIKELIKSKAYNVTERQQIESVMKQLNLSFDEAMDPKTAAKVGKLASANTAIFGTINEYNFVPDEFTILGVRKTQYVATVGLTIRLVDINTGLILESVDSTATAKKDSIGTSVFSTGSTASDGLKVKLFTEAAGKAVKNVVKQLSPIIQNNAAALVAAKSKSTEMEEPAPKSTPTSKEPERAITKSTSDENPKVTRVIKEVVYLSGMSDVKIGDILSVFRGTGEGKEIAVIEITEVNERTAKAKIVQGTGIQANDRVKVIQ